MYIQIPNLQISASNHPSILFSRLFGEIESRETESVVKERVLYKGEYTGCVFILGEKIPPNNSPSVHIFYFSFSFNYLIIIHYLIIYNFNYNL